MNRPKLKPRPPDFGSVAPSSEAPRIKYQKILVLICCPVSLPWYQKAFFPWVLAGDAETGEMSWVCVEHLLNVSLVQEYKTLSRGELNKQITYR